MKGAIIAKLSPIHLGLIGFVNCVYKESESILFLVGGASAKSLKYPFNYDERIEMLKGAMAEWFPGRNYSYGPIENTKGDDQLWFSRIKNAYGSLFDVLYSGNPQVRRIFIENGYKSKSHSLEERISSTNIRERIINGVPYRHLVPKSVFEYLENMDAHSRLLSFKGELYESEILNKFISSNLFVSANHNLSSAAEFSRLIDSLSPFMLSELGYSIEFDVKSREITLKALLETDRVKFAQLKNEYLEFSDKKTVSVTGTTFTDVIRDIIQRVKEIAKNDESRNN